jgi:calcineurin-like phosphoesterase family protein
VSCVFAISDTHFGHGKVIEFEAAHRPFATIEEHDRELVSRWNAVVTKRDVVWHLGDVYFGGKDAHHILAELKGTKRLVLGNHDSYPLEIYQRYFDRIYGAAEYRHCILTHVPVHPNQFGRYRANIHGHLHSNRYDDARYICVSAEQTGLQPVHFDSLLDKING